MSGSLPHSIAIANHTANTTVTPGYTTYDLRSDEDTNMEALNARNAKASSDFVVTISEEGQALAQRNNKEHKETQASKRDGLLLEFEEFIDEDDILINNKEKKTTHYDEEEKPTGEILDNTV
ncbi:MAG: hypothetical protein HWE24_19205 [Oceanospirillaceae bacterium]|nr:hypothetical protein [Oceanospirillaceae bacterium]